MRYPKCPKCRSANVGKIMWGDFLIKPSYREQFDKDVSSGKIHLGGGTITDINLKWHCNGCENEWGDRSDSLISS
jgi:hypothetical protein